MNIVITGGTGFLGQPLTRFLLAEGHSLTVLSRTGGGTKNGVEYMQCDWKSDGAWMRKIDGADAVIHLAGKNLAEKRWNPDVQRELIASRVETTAALVEAIRRAKKRPALLISVSAAGFYGDTGEREVRESDGAGTDFLATLCSAWETEAQKAEALGVRVAIPRIGVVFDTNGGALQKILLPFSFFVGGWFASGRQWFPWISLEDAVRAIAFPLSKPSLSGAYNVVAPEPVRMKECMKIIGSILRRPAWTSVPAFVLRIALGDFADALLFSQKIIPHKLLEEKFTFRQPRIQTALQEILAKKLG